MIASQSSTDTIVRGDPVTITILANDGYVAPVTPGPTVDNPVARSERLDAPAGAVARGVGMLAAEAVERRVGGSSRLGLCAGGGADENRLSLTASKTAGRLNLGLTVTADNGIDTANLLTGEWRF